MERFIRSENIRLYRKLLAETSDADRREMLLKLLAEEEEKDGNIQGTSQGSAPAGKLPNAP